jgi:hypothetical protein
MVDIKRQCWNSVQLIAIHTRPIMKALVMSNVRSCFDVIVNKDAAFLTFETSEPIEHSVWLG